MKIRNVSLIFTTLQEDAPLIPCNSPALCVSYLQSGFEQNPDQESFWIILLNRKNKAIGRQMITLGTATSCLAHPREVFRTAIMASATGIICAHNHPSGDPAPSNADVQITRILREAAKTVDIELIDHVIVGDKASDPVGKGYYSFREAGIV
jgi:DNA repair protein RadC